MRAINNRGALIFAAVAVALGALPGLSLGSSHESPADAAFQPSSMAAGGTTNRAKKPRCHKVRASGHGQKRRVCKKRKPSRPLARPPTDVVGPPAPAPGAVGRAHA